MCDHDEGFDDAADVFGVLMAQGAVHGTFVTFHVDDGFVVMRVRMMTLMVMVRILMTMLTLMLMLRVMGKFDDADLMMA